MDIKPLGATPSRMGADSFTGTVWQEPIIGTGTGADQGRVGTIRAESTHGMAHPSAGPNPARGLRRGPGSTVGRPAARNPLATVWIAPGEKHWHGAGPDTNMVHIALQEALDGTHVAWLEHVTDEQYNAKTDA